MREFTQRVMSARAGQTHLFSVGQAGYIIKSAGGQLLSIDLYLSECVERIEGHKGFKRLLPKLLAPSDLEFDVVICTHPHLDHFDMDSVPEMLGGGRTKLFCSVDCEKLVKQLDMEYHNAQITYVSPGESFDAGDFHIDIVNCDHGSGAPDAVGVVVTVDGKRIYEAGDTCLRLDRVDEIKAVGDLDVMIAPVNGAFGNLNETECAALAEALKPAVTVPCHYGMFASHGGNPGIFYDIMREKNLPVLLMAQGEQYTL